MPNYVINNITLTGSQSEIEAVCELLRNKNNDNNEDIDFNNIIPMPKSMNLVAGGCDKWYVAAYIQTLPEDERMKLAQNLLMYSDGYYKSYYHKYQDAFTKDIPSEELIIMQKTLKKIMNLLTLQQ